MFIAGFKPAEWVAAGVAATGVIAAALAPPKQSATRPAAPAPEPAAAPRP